MNSVTKNAFKGYSFQEIVFRYYIFLMDMNDDIQSISAEVGSNGIIKFDDIKINTKESVFFVQVKNISVGNLEIKNDTNQIVHGGVTTSFDPNVESVYIFQAQINPYPINSSFFGDNAYKLQNLYLVNLNSNQIWDFIEKNIYLNSRIEQILRLVDEKISLGDFAISRRDLPVRVFFSTTLSEQTYSIRQNFMSLNKGPIFVVGKPGVGKSHLISELNICDKDIYRFWISESDTHRNQRLQFDAFISELTAKLFDKSARKSKHEILDALKNRENYFFIDGIDHIERYNPLEMDEYVEFFNKLICSNAKIILLSRPLINKNIALKNIKQIQLNNWNIEETRQYCIYQGIKEYSIQSQIFDLTNGYPIITRYVIEEYKLTKTIPFEKPITTITDYYSRIININHEGTSALKILSYFPSFFTKDEILRICPDSYDCLLDFINHKPFLFNKIINRYYFLHDSFLNYLLGINDSQTLIAIKKKIRVAIETSVLDGETEFMGRLSRYKMHLSFLGKIFSRYANLKNFNILCSKMLDFESISNMYSVIRFHLNDVPQRYRTAKKLLNFSLILLILSRNNIEDNYNFLYQLWDYFKIHNLNYSSVFYSNGNVFNAFAYFDDLDIKRYILNEIQNSYGIQKSKYDIDLAIESEKNFFNQFEKDNTSLLINKIKSTSSFLNDAGENIFTKLLVYIWKFKHTEISVFNDFDKYLFNLSTFNEMEYKYSYYIRTIKGNDDFDVRFSIQSAAQLIHEMDLLGKKGKYYRKRIKNICIENAINGSWNLISDITSLLRLANREKRELDINNLYLYYRIYYQRKDYCITYLPDVLCLVSDCKCKKHFVQNIYWIEKFQEMSEKGIRSIYCDYINLCFSKSADILRQIDALNPNEHNLFIGWLSTKTLNYMTTDEVTKIFLHPFSPYYPKSISKEDLRFVLQSNHSLTIQSLISRHDIEVRDYNSGSSLGYLISRTNKYISGSDFKKGFLSSKDINYFKAHSIDMISLSSMLSGNYCTLPYSNIFNIFNYKEVEEKLFDIIVNGLSAKGQFSVPPSLWEAFKTIPEMMLKYKKISKKHLRHIINDFINILIIENV